MRQLISLLVWVLCIGCSGTPEAFREFDISSYPADWPQPLRFDPESNECILLTGTFNSKGQSTSNLGERFLAPVFERNFFGLDTIADPSNLFRVTHKKHQRRLYFDILDSNHEQIFSGVYKGYSRCQSGWLISESQVVGGSGDNPTRSQTELVLRTLAEDGSLIIGSFLQVKTGKFFVFLESSTSDIWYRFPSAK